MPTVPPELKGLQTDLLSYANWTRQNPMSGLQPLQLNATDQINRRYIGAPDRIATQLAKRGYSGSGAAGGAYYGLERDRLGQLSDLDAIFAQMGLDRERYGAELGTRLLGMGTGTTSTSTTPGNMLGAGFSAAGSAVANLGTLMSLQKLLSPGGGNAGYSNPGSYYAANPGGGG